MQKPKSEMTTTIKSRPRKKSTRGKGAPRATQATSSRLKELWATPEFREKMKHRDQARIAAAKADPTKFYRYGVPDGMRRAEAEHLWVRANELADRFIEGLKEKGEIPDLPRQVANNRDAGILVPPTDQGKAEGALREAFVLAVGPSTPRVKAQAVNIVLTYTKTKPTAKDALLRDRPEDFLNTITGSED
jgi:hypothetical protein